MIAAHPAGQRGDGGRRGQPRGRRAEGDAAREGQGAAVRAARGRRRLDVAARAQGAHGPRLRVRSRRASSTCASTRSGRRRTTGRCGCRPGAKVKNTPTAAKGSGPFGSYEVTVEERPAMLHVKTTVTLAKTRILRSEYPAFRAWCEEVDRALGPARHGERQVRALWRLSRSAALAIGCAAAAGRSRRPRSSLADLRAAAQGVGRRRGRRAVGARRDARPRRHGGAGRRRAGAPRHGSARRHVGQPRARGRSTKRTATRATAGRRRTSRR